MAEGAVKKASDEKREVDIAYKNWYFYVQDAFACGASVNRSNDRTDNTTFQQVFFGPAVSCGTYVQSKCEQCQSKCEQCEEKKSFFTGVEDEFYNALRQGFESQINNNLRMDNPRVQLTNLKTRMEWIISDIFEDKFNEDFRSSNHIRLKQQVTDYRTTYKDKDIEKPNTYKRDKEKIYEQYIGHKEFYIYYLCGILDLMSRSGLENVFQISKKACDKLMDILSYIPSAEGMAGTLEITAYYLYCLILASINRDEFIRKNSESGHLSGLINKSDISIRLQRDDFISVTEYYPVNTVERLGALEKLADNDNIYALQELYFLYQNNTVLYNASGEKRLLLKKDPVKSAEIYSRLSGNDQADRLPLFRNEEKRKMRNSLLSMLEDYRRDYDSSDSDDRWDKTEFLKNMTTVLYKKFTQKDIPFNIELVLFLRRVLENNPDVTIEIDNKTKSAADIKDELNKYIEAFPLAGEFEPPGDKGIDFMEALIRLCESNFPEELLVAVCRSYANHDKLFTYSKTAINKTSYYSEAVYKYREKCRKSGESSDKNLIDKLKKLSDLWIKVYNIIDNALDE